MCIASLTSHFPALLLDLVNVIPEKHILTLTRIWGFGGAWLAQLVKHLTLDLSSGHHLTVRGMETRVGLCADSVEPAWDSLSLYPCPFPARVLSLSQNKKDRKSVV